MASNQIAWKKNYSRHSTRFLLEIYNDNLLPAAKKILECELVERGLEPPFKLDRSLPLRDSEVRVLNSMHGDNAFNLLEESGPDARPSTHDWSGGGRGVSDIKDNDFLNLPTEQLKAIRRDTSLQVMRDLIDSILVVRENAQRDKKYSSRKNIFFKAFCGELPLWSTFWIFGVIILKAIEIMITVGFGAKTAHFWTYLVLNYGMIAFQIIAITLALLFIAYKVAIIRGIWTSASKYTGPKAWAVLAKVLMVLWAIGIVPEFLEMSAILKLEDPSAMAAPKSSLDMYGEMVRNLLN